MSLALSPSVALDNAKERQHDWLLLLAGMLVASLVILGTRGLINNDGVLYLESARLYAQGLWREGMQIYPWPLYPLLIALVHQASGLGLQHSAHLLTLLFFAFTCVGLARLVRELGGNAATALLAGLLLLASPYLIDDIVPKVLRDHGAWCFHLWSLVFLLRFTRTASWQHALLWGGCAVLALLFRIELLTFLVLLPLAQLQQHTHPLPVRIQLLLKSQALLLSLGALLLLALALSELQLQNLGRLHEPIDVLARVYTQLTQGLAGKAEILQQQVLGSYLDDYALATLLLSLLYILFIKAAGCAGWLQFGAALSIDRKNTTLTPQGWRLLKWLLGLGLLNGAVILLNGFLLPGRMLAPIGFVVIILAAFGLERLRQQWLLARGHRGRRAWAFPLVAAALALQLLAILWPSSARDTYELDAARWVVQHVPPGSRVLFGSARLAYYAGQPLDQDLNNMHAQALRILAGEEIRAYAYAVVGFTRKSSDAPYTLRFGNPIGVFANSRGDRVLIYRIPQDRPEH